MRKEISFRAWDLDNRKMYFDNVERKENDGDSCLHFFWGFTLPRNQLTFNHIIMQYIGIKDKNGKNIYEGDILKEIDICGDEKIIIIPKKIRHIINKCYFIYGWGLEKFEEEYTEVIGNIYENPELI